MVVARVAPVDTSWIKDLPKIYEANQAKKLRKETLADIDINDPYSLQSKANELLQRGGADEETQALAMRLSQMAKVQIDTQQTRQQREAFQKLAEREAGLGEDEDESPQIDVPAAIAPPPLAPGGVPGGPPALPQAPVPMDTSWAPQPAGFAPGGTEAFAQPSAPPEIAPPKQVTAQLDPRRVQQGPSAGPQWGAQAGPSQWEQPVPPMTPEARGDLMPEFPVDPQVSPNIPRNPKLANKLRMAQALLMNASNQSERDYAKSKIEQITKQMEPTPEERLWQSQQRQNVAMGRPVEDIDSWKQGREVGPKAYDAATKTYEKYQKGKETADRGLTVLNQMDDLLKNPALVLGEGTQVWHSLTSSVSGLADMAGVIGLDLNKYDLVKNSKTVAGLRDVFRALSNDLVHATLGSLGNQISNSDREFIVAAFPNLLLTKDGNKVLVDLMRKALERRQHAFNVANTYFNKRGHKATAYEMDKFVTEWAEKNTLYKDKQGKLTTEGERVKAEWDKAKAWKAEGGVDDKKRSVLDPRSDKRSAADVVTGGFSRGFNKALTGQPRPKVPPGKTFYDQSGNPYVMGPDGKPVPAGGGT